MSKYWDDNKDETERESVCVGGVVMDTVFDMLIWVTSKTPRQKYWKVVGHLGNECWKVVGVGHQSIRNNWTWEQVKPCRQCRVEREENLVWKAEGH